MTEKITTAEELDALPVGSVVVDLFDNGEFHKMRTGRWIDTGGSRWLASEMVQDEQEYALYRPGAPTPPLQPEADREALRVALTDGYWQRTGYRANWEHIGPLMDAILDAGFTLAARQPAPTVSAEQVRRDTLIEVAEMLDGADGYDALSGPTLSGTRWTEESVYDAVAASGPITDWLRVRAQEVTP